MVAQGYFPSQDRMKLIECKATTLRRVFVEWWKDSQLPGFPLDFGSHDALREMFALDCALNPDRLAWDDPERSQPSARAWSDRTISGLYWLRRLLDILIERAGVRSLGEAKSFDAWIGSNPAIPESVSIKRDELKALGRAIERMSGDLRPKPNTFSDGEADLDKIERRLHDRLSQTASGRTSTPQSNADLQVAEAVPACPVRVIAPGVRPWVEGGGECKKLSKPQYDVLAALIAAHPGVLTGKELKDRSEHEDAVNTLKNLKDSNPNTIGRYIHMPGQGGRGYGLGYPQAPQVSNQEPTTELSDLAELIAEQSA